MDGYKIIDFKGLDITEGPTIPGIFKAINESNKPLVINNLKIGSALLKPFASGIITYAEATGYTFFITTPDGPYAVNISDDDVVIIIA